LVNDNILDSFDIMQILLEIEKINNKKFNNNNINRDSFKNIKSILALIKL
jgi:acyl carrier protein